MGELGMATMYHLQRNLVSQMPTTSKSFLPQANMRQPRQWKFASAIWPRLIELWLASILITFFVVRILGSRFVQHVLGGLGHRHLP
jgi:hypothetical protein